MIRPKFSIVATLALGFGVLAGCEKPDTNNYTPENVAAAQKSRQEMIDNDPKMTPQQKEAMKRALRITPGGPPGSQPGDRGSR